MNDELRIQWLRHVVLNERRRRGEVSCLEALVDQLGFQHAADVLGIPESELQQRHKSGDR